MTLPLQMFCNVALTIGQPTHHTFKLSVKLKNITVSSTTKLFIALLYNKQVDYRK